MRMAAVYRKGTAASLSVSVSTPAFPHRRSVHAKAPLVALIAILAPRRFRPVEGRREAYPSPVIINGLAGYADSRVAEAAYAAAQAEGGASAVTAHHRKMAS
jgi:hypothetical protein